MDDWPRFSGAVIGKIILASLIVGGIWLVKRVWREMSKQPPTGRNKSAEKRYPLGDATSEDRVLAVCGALRTQFVMLNEQSPKLVLRWSSDGQPTIDLWLLGYISGFYDAHCQYSGHEFEDNALELIYCVFFGEAEAEAAIKHHFIVCMSVKNDGKASHTRMFGFGEFHEGRVTGGNNLMNWMDKTIKAPFDLYWQYSGGRTSHDASMS